MMGFLGVAGKEAWVGKQERGNRRIAGVADALPATVELKITQSHLCAAQ
jgi:hypothetical protein